MSSLEFTDDELIEQLRQLSYHDVSHNSLQKFKHELNEMVHSYKNAVDMETGYNPSENLQPENITPKSTPLMENFSHTNPSPSTLDYRSDLSLREKSTSQGISFFINGSSNDDTSTHNFSQNKKPLVRKNVRQVNGKSFVYVESRTGSEDDTTNEFSTSTSASTNSFAPLTPYTSSSYSEQTSGISSLSMNHSTPKVNQDFTNFDKNRLSSTSSNTVDHRISELIKRPRNLSRSSIVSIEKLPRNMLSSSILSEIDNYDDTTSSITVSDDNFIDKISNRNPPTLRRTRSCGDLCVNKYTTKSFIRPMKYTSKLTRNRRNDPVQRYHEYKKFWNAYKTPGENSHKQLRWMVREHMLSGNDDLGKFPRGPPKR